MSGWHSKGIGVMERWSNGVVGKRLARRRLSRRSIIPSLQHSSSNWSAWQDLHLQPSRFERDASSLGYTRVLADGHHCARPPLRTARSAPGQDCTDTERGLSPLPLLWATGAEPERTGLMDCWISGLMGRGQAISDSSIHESTNPSIHSEVGAA